MTDILDTAVDESRAGAIARPGRRRDRFGHAPYVLTLIAIPALFLLSAIAVVRSGSFLTDSGDPFLLNSNYVTGLKHVDCGVIVFGDSTAETGIDPTVIARGTGLKTCNIAQAQSIIEILGMGALNTYLADNAPPKFIVFQFDPETLARDNSNFFWPEGLTLLFRQRSLTESLPVAARHPVRFYEFAIWAIKARLVARLHPGPSPFAAMEREFQARSGLLTLPKPPETRCGIHARFLPPAKSWIEGLRRRYTTDTTRVLVDVSPVPGCEGDKGRVARAMDGITDNPLPVFPIDSFNDLDRHLTLEGADRLSLQIVRQIERAGVTRSPRPSPAGHPAVAGQH